MRLPTRNAYATALLCASALASGADLDNGADINQVCAGCHGEFGQGGKDGEYPRLAGLPAAFIARQLHLFRNRERPNLAMIEYIDERQMPDKDIADVAAFLAAQQLPSKLPPVDPQAPGFDALARLLQAKRSVQIRRAAGDVETGRQLYRKECASCHGRDGQGDPQQAVPMLAGQYTEYLWRQVTLYREERRIHDPQAPEDKLLSDFSQEQLRDILAYLSIADD
jgi:cytochrome c553